VRRLHLAAVSIATLGAFMTHADEPTAPATTNRLARAASPYLLQHAANPVDWFPWGEEAFQKAAAEDKPIFLSIGYATCHWCHVMAHESFEDPEVAALMNEAFVNVKVDREERPDIDQVFMTVCQMMTGGGGWPLTIIMTPDREPFYAATYLPRDSRFGRVGMTDLVPQVQQLWLTDRSRIASSARSVVAALEAAAARRSPGTLGTRDIDEAFKQLAGRYDAVRGGFGAAPKFPSPHNLVFLTRYWRQSGNRLAIDIVEHTLERMRLGGIYDQVGFGWHRYSTDAEWLVPHFEKMLYDQATMTIAATEGWHATRNPVLERIVRETIAYVLRDMTSPEGAFYSAEDADSSGEEGLFYLWTLAEVQEVVGEGDAAFAAAVWNLEEGGNYTDEARRVRTGRNIPHLAEPHAALARRLGMGGDDFERRLEAERNRLFTAREARVHPLKDDKVLCDWNSLMAAALAFAGRVFNEPAWIEAADSATAFIHLRMRTADGRLLHRYRGGSAGIPGFLDDYVFLTAAHLELYDATFDPRHLRHAVALQRQTVELFHDAEHGGFFFSAVDSERLQVRQKEIYDGAMPSGNSMATDNLVRLARLLGDGSLGRLADGVFSAFAGEAARLPSAHAQLMAALLRASSPSIEIVVAGEPEGEDTRALLDVVRAAAPPQTAVLVVPPGSAGDPVRKMAAFAEACVPVAGRAAAYVCRDFSCRLPTTDPGELAELLRAASAGDPGAA
jgi:uncharacterized protein YyaL (SSP411 family)